MKQYGGAEVNGAVGRCGGEWSSRDMRRTFRFVARCAAFAFGEQEFGAVEGVGV